MEGNLYQAFHYPDNLKNKIMWSAGKPSGTVKTGYLKDVSDPKILDAHLKGMHLTKQIEEMQDRDEYDIEYIDDNHPLHKLDQLLRRVPDFPKPGIMFYDIDPLLNNAKAFDFAVSSMSFAAAHMNADIIAGPEARGFIFAGAVAARLECGVALIRKPGKLPAEKISQEYGLEYGRNVIEMHTTAIQKGQRVVIVDDLLATGGTIDAAVKLITRLGGHVTGVITLVELSDLGGRKLLEEQGIRVDHILRK